MNEQNKLDYFLELLENKITFDSFQDRFDAIAECLMNYLCLEVGKTRYRITECEIYYNDVKGANEHPDIYTHGEPPQLTVGNLYLNKARGLDITFGNSTWIEGKELKVYAGILIRGIRDLETGVYINQITKIVKEVFIALGNIITDENSIRLRVLMPGLIQFENPVKSTRIRLKLDESDINKFFLEKPYRYLVEILEPSHEYFARANFIKQLLKDNKISPFQAKQVLNYNPAKNDNRLTN